MQRRYGVMMKPGDRIRKAVDARGVTLTALGNAIGEPQGNVSQMVAGKRSIRGKLSKIAAFLDVSEYWITSGGDDPVPPPSVSEPEGRAMRQMRSDMAALVDCVKMLVGRVLVLERAAPPRSEAERIAREERVADLERLADRLDSGRIAGVDPGGRREIV